MSAPQLSHLNAAGEVHMVELGDRPATAHTIGPTGVEMEALRAVQVGLLTLYDMLNGGWWCRPICC
ncbi:MAG: cyclic pyranopterin monophosphate synthase MoaC [Cyanobium usitatum Tobar12.5m-G36]|nr:cyclic pyranopterin monophosphate synthase MoaC [Cyanobium usitatum Tobar12.5m-G36]